MMLQSTYYALIGLFGSFNHCKNRQIQGHMLLIGVSGAGKTLLTRFTAWMDGLSFVNLKIHNKYEASDFDEDLKKILVRAGSKGEKICFILDESDVTDVTILERMNTLLANAEIPGLFEGDEFSSLMLNTKEAASALGLSLDSTEKVYEWFRLQVMKNLHIVFTMNPPSSENLQNKLTASPALFNRIL
jgi:dynein heavy chain 1